MINMINVIAGSVMPVVAGAAGAAVVAVVAVVAVLSVQVVEGELPDTLLARSAVEEQLGVDTAVGGRYDGCPVGEGADETEDTVRVGRPVELVHHDEVGEVEVPVDLGVPGAGLVELGGVDDLDEPAVHDPRMLAGEDHPDEFPRFGEPAGLDDDDVDAGGGAGEAFEVDVQLTGVEGAAQAAVAEGDRGVAERARHGHGVDLDGAEVVHDRADTAASAAMEEVVEQRRLAGTQESGEYDDRDLLRSAALRQRATSLTPTRAPARGPAHGRGLNAQSGYEPEESPRSERLLAASAGQTLGKAPWCATLTSLRAPPLRLPRRSEPLGTLGDGKRRPPARRSPSADPQPTTG